MDSAKIMGGEFRINLDALQCALKRNNAPEYSLGRTCFYAILEAIKTEVGGILLPDYMCSSVMEVPLRIGIPFRHYHISTNFIPDIENIRSAVGNPRGRFGIVLISYFGLIDLDDIISSIRSEFPNMIIIVDDVQNYYGFGTHIDYDYCFTSYRKWFAVPEGADILQKEGAFKVEKYSLQSNYSYYKAAGNLLKNHKGMIGDSISLELIAKGEKLIEREYCYTCSDLSRNLYQRIDVEFVADKRKMDAKYLHESLKRLNIRHLYDPEKIPLFIPIVVSNRDKIRNSLFAENIFVPIHWPVEDINVQGNNELYRTELSLICDQRYDEEDMERMIRGIENAM